MGKRVGIDSPPEASILEISDSRVRGQGGRNSPRNVSLRGYCLSVDNDL